MTGHAGDQEIAALEARNWIRAAVLCGLIDSGNTKTDRSNPRA